MTEAEIQKLKDEVAFWREDAYARLWFRVQEYKHLKGADARATHRVAHLMPTLAAITEMQAGTFFETCEFCSATIRPTDAYVRDEDGFQICTTCYPDTRAHYPPSAHTPEQIDKLFAEAMRIVGWGAKKRAA